ncbi:S1 domain-containing RNA-binding protein [Liquorilactobacillus satsumensis]|uniref:RNA-binding protein n=1 Tax=Liquorilactobacillus satsumensis DSM 16230 = JCM 12392 TaxID=1423801 RepID=A0A0R1V9Q8_9LACO|nr:S1 domain-containing RNA-binding protein [Liquorilactobacillus satsumensis]KRM00025.1 RNA-binding protein [Liquorilactobacillus satsumensis DSM 16230 = JCM 12392]MCC7666984.1 RNA-binding protein S1 [Liquorilactobacillus satsumensis]MCP9313604.1 RNA-binding protein S1 [Liquorilactobacillus satsumensis]MCP9329717.1 RNA-binding protein S1 [Liquorilactobacillus satsumensis]MCP9358600.1 RNA-binding protein S1 [Liquorilactobacillus satsumensis]
MAIEVGAKVTGRVSGITNFGAFVDLGEKKNGLVHISEISDSYVKDIHDVLSVGDEVTVKVLSIAADGKISLSIRKATASAPSNSETKFNKSEHHESYNHAHHTSATGVKTHSSNGHYNQSYRKPEPKPKDFDSLLSGFLKESEARLTSLKRNTEGKRGGRGGRRS